MFSLRVYSHALEQEVAICRFLHVMVVTVHATESLLNYESHYI